MQQQIKQVLSLSMAYSELIKKALFGLAEVINIDSRMEPP